MPLYRGACRCVSTSTAPPCVHAAVVRHLSTTAVVAVAQEATTSSEPSHRHGHSHNGNSLDYAAPLWERDDGGDGAGDRDDKWFRSVGRTWRGWIKQSRASTLPPTSSSSTTTTTKAAPRAPSSLSSIPSHRWQTSTGFSSSGANEDQLEAINRYIALRGTLPPGLVGAELVNAVASAAAPTELQNLRAAAKNQGLSMVEHQIREDERRVVTADTSASAASPPLLPDHVDVRQVMLSLLETSRTAPDQLPSCFRTDLQAETPHCATDVDRLRILWQSFSAKADFDKEQDMRHTLAFLVFLATSTAAAPSPHSSSFLPLALEVLQSVLDSPTSRNIDIAPSPSWLNISGTFAPQHVAFRAVVLRTVVPLALELRDLTLALHAVSSLATLRAEHCAPVDVSAWPGPGSDSSDRDLRLLSDVSSAALEVVRLERLTTYSSGGTNGDLHFSATGVTALSALAEVLLRQAPRLLRPASVDDAEPDPIRPRLRFPSSLASQLNGFVDEAAAVNRLDLVARTWRVWSANLNSRGKGEAWGWELKKRRRLGLARYFAGESPASIESQKAPTLVLVREFALLARETGELIRAGRGALDDWSTEVKVAWLELLAQSRASGRRKDVWRELKAAYEVWTARGAVNGFAVGGGTTLVLAKAAVKFGDRAFAQKLASDLIGVLTRQSSPFALAAATRKAKSTTGSSSPQIDHYNLTALAAVYALLGDQASVAQVYRKMLQQKILPDQRDVDLILESTPVGDGDANSIATFLRWTNGLGVEITKKHFERMLRRIFAEAGEGTELEDEQVQIRARDRFARADALLRVASEVGLSKIEQSQLKSYARLQQRRLDHPADRPRAEVTFSASPLSTLSALLTNPSTGLVHPPSVARHLQLAIAAHDWRLALSVHMAAVRLGFQDDHTVHDVTKALLKAFRTEGVRGREAVRRGLRAIIGAVLGEEGRRAEEQEEVVAGGPLCVIDRTVTANLIYRAAMKLDDGEGQQALITVRRLMDKMDVAPSGQVQQVVRRWAIAAAGGKDPVREIGGWLEEA